MNNENENLAEKIAVSLQYDSDESSAPKVTAKGSGLIAQQIIETAEQHNIPIQKDHELVELLAQVELDAEIPATLYEAVAQVLVFAYQVSGKLDHKAEQNSNPHNKADN
ncbi:EscU/YscU/HrcU family type III secretion system export apparatus switch protein [Thiomicrorhabdus sediminis]|uniref:Flagellar biosynthetic protein FlhB n=1 Tax=Thiomicrorhabdus sediminis TaxID=2580412 RepID=A0A4P9K6F7_9GAMM|nr:EscU/YscU/HrcU family type III secretion system export apparatus switch protein [Thiomicrorhabdus sediminis]QCU90431.1 flagellar protein FhlB [Thiomicrorhabdus sediminis]